MENIDYDYVDKTAKAATQSVNLGGTFVYFLIGLGCAILVACLVLLIIILVKLNKMNNSMANKINVSSVQDKIGDLSQSVGCVFCPSCGNQYDASEKMCPYCKTKKMI